MQKLQKLLNLTQKLNNIINRVTSNKTKQVQVEKKLNDLMTSHTKLINNLERETSHVLTKVPTTFLMETSKIIFIFILFLYYSEKINYLTLLLHLK